MDAARVRGHHVHDSKGVGGDDGVDGGGDAGDGVGVEDGDEDGGEGMGGRWWFMRIRVRRGRGWASVWVVGLVLSLVLSFVGGGWEGGGEVEGSSGIAERATGVVGLLTSAISVFVFLQDFS
ncbi:hypothetical protein BKA64DRAFT_411715 [Cadophora sp. MPI-SDFR-AT-0126]|nr:hypothetical protein BKA64DRAFT_411715 [Leotiomycetes sp. MPI-SDFR-AT-0126]